MKSYIALLRGINVGGHRKILMADLRKMFEDLGYQSVRSYIQSGNIVFNTDEEDAAYVERFLEERILEKFGFQVPVLLREKNEWQEMMQNNPFLKGEEPVESLHITFLASKPLPELLPQLESRQTENDQIQIRGKHAYLLIKGSYHKTPLNNQWLEKTLQTQTTTRNWKGVLKIWELVKD